MSGLLKNQIAKQLARFTKNLSPNKISLKFLKGEGELHNLELNEKILTDLLELPPWLRLTKAVCNKISAKIHWTKLKTDPICLYLDCVEVDMEAVTDTCQKAPSQIPTQQFMQNPAKERQPTKYGFVEKVVDGMYVQINSVVVSFKSTSFLATINMSRLVIRSTSHEWKPADLRLTRIKDDLKGQVLTFKQITWSTLRIDANALYNHKTCYQTSSPLRLITSHSSLNITIKKSIEDCSVLSARLELLLDDILWVLNQTQLQALAGFLNSIGDVFNKTGAGQEPGVNPAPAGQAAQPQTQYIRSNVQTGTEKPSYHPLFKQYDVIETSYHLRTGRIDLHLCDDSSLTHHAKQQTVEDTNGGAMQIQINRLSLDHYPYHLAGTSRAGWVCHNEAALQRAYWVNQLLNTFRTCLRNKGKHSHSTPVMPTPTRAHPATPCNSGTSSQSHSVPASPRQAPKSPHPTPNQQQQQAAHSLSNPQKRPVFMYESCFMLRCEEFSVQPVMMSNSSGVTVPFLSSDKKALFLPSDMPAFQLDYTQYYYPVGIKSMVPAPNLFVQLNPVQLTLDPATCVWFNRFMHSILSGASWAEDLAQQSMEQQPTHIDIRIEALMPKIIIPCPSDPNAYYKESRPQAVQLQMSQVFVTNSRIGSNSTQSDLLMFLQEFQASKLYADLSVFPNLPEDVHPLPNVAWVNDSSVVDEASVERNLSGIQENGQHSKQFSQVWSISAEQMWLDFIGVASANNRPVPFVDAIPLHMWICTPLPTTPTCNFSDTDVGDGCAQSANRGSVESNLPFSPDSPPNINRQPFGSKLPYHRKISEPLSPASLQKARAELEQYSFLHNSSSSPNLNQKSESTSGEILNHHPGLSGGLDICSRTQDRDCNSLPASPRRFVSRLNPAQMQEEGQQSKKTLCQVASSTSVASTTSSSSLPSVPDSESSQEEFVMVDKEVTEPPPVYEECSRGMNIPNGHCVRDVSQPLVFDEKPPPYEEPSPAGEGPNMNGLSKYQNCNGVPPSYSTVPQTMNGPNLSNGVRNGYTFHEPAEEAPPLPEKAPIPEATLKYFTGIADEKGQILKSQDVQVADMTVLIAFHETVKVQLDHFQFVFLLRMQEMLTKLMEDIEKGRSKYEVKSAGSPTAPEPAVTCHLLTKGAEVNIILPPTPEVNQTVGSCHGNTSTASSYQDTGIVSDVGSESMAVDSMSPDSLNTDDDKISDLPDDSTRYSETQVRNDTFTTNTDTISTPVNFSHSDSVPVSDILSPRTDASGTSGRASVASDVSSEAWMLGAESERSSRADQSSRRNSEGSCASAGRESSLSVTDDGVKKAKKYKKASIVTVQGSDIQLGVQMKGLHIAVKVAAQKLGLSEAGNVNLDKFINRKSAKTTSIPQPTPIPQTDSWTPMVCVRAEIGPMARRHDPVAEERGFAHVKLSDLVASLTISNAESLSDCFEDELLIPAMPFLVELRNSQVSVINDAPPRLLSAPPPIPINLGIQSITIRRNDDGSLNIFGMQTDSNTDRRCVESPRQSSASASEISLSDGVMSPKLDELDNENHRLSEQLAVTQTALRSVQEEREALLKTIERLQMELAISNREQEQLQEKLLVLTYPRGSSPRKTHR